jgi:hypothetical protein
VHAPPQPVQSAPVSARAPDAAEESHAGADGVDLRAVPGPFLALGSWVHLRPGARVDPDAEPLAERGVGLLSVSNYYRSIVYLD